MRNEEAQIIAKVIGIVSHLSAQIVWAKQMRAWATTEQQAAWDETIAEAKGIRTQSIEHLGTMLAGSCFGKGEAIELNTEIINRLERIVNDQKTILEGSKSAG